MGKFKLWCNLLAFYQGFFGLPKSFGANFFFNSVCTHATAVQ